MDNIDPTIDEVREWGYDQDMLFMEQDEDLILHSPQYVTILIELAGDDNCPKKDYCSAILQYYASIQLANRTKELADIVSTLKQSGIIPNVDLENWRSKYLLFRSSFLLPGRSRQRWRKRSRIF